MQRLKNFSMGSEHIELFVKDNTTGDRSNVTTFGHMVSWPTSVGEESDGPWVRMRDRSIESGRREVNHTRPIRKDS